MRRATYHPQELRAGMTVFFGGCRYETPFLDPEVAEFLISDNGPNPVEGEHLSYRISRAMATQIAASFPLYRTRRAARRAAGAISRDARARLLGG